MKHKATPEMIRAVRAVPTAQRAAAARLAADVFLTRLARFNDFADFPPAVNARMAGDAAAAEVEFRFGRTR